MLRPFLVNCPTEQLPFISFTFVPFFFAIQHKFCFQKTLLILIQEPTYGTEGPFITCAMPRIPQSLARNIS